MQEEMHKAIAYGSIWRMVGPMCRPLLWLVGWIVVLALMLAVLNVAEPYIYGSIIDSVTRSIGTHVDPWTGVMGIVPYLAAWIGVVLLATGLNALHAWLVWYMGNRLCLSSNGALFQKMLTLTVHRFQDERSGAMLHRFVSTDEALWGLNGQVLRNLVQSFFTSGIIIAVGLYFDWRLMVVALVIIPVIVVMGIWNLHVSSRLQERMSEKWEAANGLVGDAFSNITAVQSEAGEDRVFRRFLRAYKESMKQQLRINIQWAFLEAGGGGIFILGRLLLFFVGVYFVFSGTTTLGTLIMFLGFSGNLYGTVQNVMHELPMATKSLNRMSRSARVWDEVPDVRDRSDAKRAPVFLGEVSFRNVWFSYRDASQQVLRGMDFTIPAGQTYAVVGESGAGKSTLAKLMVRFADPTKGGILVDGIDLRDVTLASLRPQVGFVMQENLLFHESIMHNIRFAKPNATPREVIQAAKRAQAHEFISKLSKGYDTVVGERGVKLSGGQKQRIALARVLLANPPILVLDEATSALDSKTEHDLQQALREVMKDRTTLVIAHRLSTVMDADRILVMDKGRIVDEGRHEELIARGGIYKQFWEIQAGGYV